ncbi:MAG TPA: CFI-box-CTERM domain-containing protein [Polyangia bacterium]|nr:CFI-box-CTERM domain-containing protein [Polyangia bacterium]
MHCGRRLAAACAAASLLILATWPGHAEECRVLVFEFQPQPYDAAHELPFPDGMTHGIFEDSGPQIAVWIESASPAGTPPGHRGSYVADVLVTRATATFGIGNRPGNTYFVSSPHFPYGNRDYALPIWAWARGHQYPLLRMQDGIDDGFGFHEPTSSRDTFYCRPLQRNELVDAVTCPTPGGFSSDKGRFDATGKKVLYPPRHDVPASMCRVRGSTCTSSCNDDIACTMLADLDDVAAISAATPSPTDHGPYVGMWLVPSGLADGDYDVFIEVAKQYDNDAGQCPVSDSQCPPGTTCDRSTRFCARHPSAYDDARLPQYGIGANLGQPSVVWWTRVRIDQGGSHTTVANDYLGFGDWDGAFGRGQQGIHPPDDTQISKSTPGSGAQRLAQFSDADGTWRFKVTARPCGSCQGAPTPPPVTDLKAVSPDGDLVQITFTHVGFGTVPVTGYQIRYKLGQTMTVADFATATPAPVVAPKQPGTAESLALTQRDGIQPQSTYTVGIRSLGDCMTTSELRTAQVQTLRKKYTTIEGCFLATAAWGSSMEPDVLTLRRFRDRLLHPHPIGRALVGLYYQASPPLSHAIARDPGLRACARALLWPEVGLARAALSLPLTR